MQVCELLQLPQPPLLFEFRGVCSAMRGAELSRVGRSIVHSTPRTASLAIFYNSVALALFGEVRTSTPRSWFLMRTLEAFTGGAEAQPRPQLSLMLAARIIFEIKFGS